MLRIEVGQEDSCLCRWRRIAIRSCARILIIRPFTGSIRGEYDTLPYPVLSYGRFEMNKKRPTAYDGSGALFLGEGTEALVCEGEGWVSSELSLLALELLGGDGAGEAFREGDFVA